LTEKDYIFLIWFLLINTLAFIIYGVDKYCARKDRRRIPERNLLILAIMGGFIGGVIGMKVFRHKTGKPSFKTRFGLACIIPVIFIALYFNYPG